MKVDGSHVTRHERLRDRGGTYPRHLCNVLSMCGALVTLDCEKNKSQINF